MEKMIDIHSHLIPKFDDGPGSFDESLEMLQQAEDQGITDVFATSHFNEWIPKAMEEEYFSKLEELRKKAQSKKIGVNIHSGAEIFYHHWVETTVKSSKVTTLGNWGQYVLIEFPMFQMPDGAEEVLFRLTAENYIPIVSHAERYVLIIEKPRKIMNFIKYGGLIQLNGGSLLGHFGKDIQKTALQLLEWQLAQFIASDAHSPRARTFVLAEVYKFLENRIEKRYLEELLFTNPNKIIEKKLIVKAQIPEELEKKGFFAQIKRRLKTPQ
jgi:protein-tyrosine phosphatase